jgi:hypothetical protein
MSFTDNLFGTAKSAYILIHDYRKSAAAADAAVNPTINALNKQLEEKTQEHNDALKALGDNMKAIGELQGAFNANTTDPLNASIQNALAGHKTMAFKNAVDKMFWVQFNPSEIQIYTSSEQQLKSSAQTEQKNQSVTKPVESIATNPPTAELSTTLYFDHMIVADSFMLDKPMGISAGGVTNWAVSLGGNTEEHSVQKEVEGFLAAIQNQYTRIVTFGWSDFSFSGTLSHVDAQYIMFSNLGYPVRAKVQMRITQQMSGTTLDTWYKALENAFGGSGATNLVRPEQTYGNLLNLGL